MNKFTGNEGQQKRLKSRERDAERQLNEDMSAVLATPEGRRLLWWVLDDVTGLHGPTFSRDSSTFWREGKRSVGIDIMQRMKLVAPDLYVTMIAEQMEQLKEDNLQQREASRAPRNGDE